MNSYRSLEATLHDVFWASEGPSLELPLLRDFLQTHPGRSLEIGCGSGRLLLPLLQEGFTVDGLELSPEMLDLCRQQSPHSGLMLHEGNMDDWQAPQPYATLMVPAFTLQLSRDPATALERFAAMLDDHGALYLSTFTPLAEILGALPENDWYPDHQTLLDDGQLATIHTMHQIDREKQILHRQHRYESPANNSTGSPASNSKPISRQPVSRSKNKSPISNPPASPSPKPKSSRPSRGRGQSLLPDKKNLPQDEPTGGSAMKRQNYFAAA
jgi:SAM-dependent methyltransferase